MQNLSTPDRSGRDKPFHGGLVLAAGFLTLLVLYGSQYSFGVFLKPILNDFGWTRAETAGAYSLNSIVFAVFSIFAGKLADRFSPALVIGGCGALVTIGFFLMSQFQSLWQLYLIYGVVLAVGISGVFITLLSTIAKWFIGKMGAPTGIVLAGIGAGIIIVPPLATFLIHTYSWRTAYMVISGLALLIPLVFSQFFRQPPPHADFSAPDNGQAADGSTSMLRQGYTLSQALRTGQLWIILGVYFISATCLQMLVVHIVAHATDVGIEPQIAATIMSAIGIVSVFSKLGTGMALDRVRTKPVLVFISVLTAISFLLLQVPPQLWIFYVFAALFAVGYGGWSTAQSPVVAEYFGLKTHGAILGTTFIGVGLGSAFGPYMAGLIFDNLKSYSLAFWGCFVLCVISILLPLFLKRTDKKILEGE